MCRNIRPLFNFDPPANDDEVRAAAIQFVRKVSGYTRPSAANAAAFDEAVDAVAAASRALLDNLTTNAPPKKPGRGGGQAQGTWCRSLRHHLIPRT